MQFKVILSEPRQKDSSCKSGTQGYKSVHNEQKDVFMGEWSD